MRRASVATLMAFVVFCGVSFAALRNANELWTGISLLLTAGMLGVSALCIAYRRGERRAAWAGFTLFGGAYLAVTTAPGCVTDVSPRLPTTYVLRHFYTLLSFPPYAQIDRLSIDIAEEKRRYRLIDRALFPVALDIKEFVKQDRVKRQYAELQTIRYHITNLEGQLAKLTKPPRPSSPSLTVHQEQVGHNLIAWLFGAVGALIAVWVYRTRDVDGDAADAHPDPAALPVRE